MMLPLPRKLKDQQLPSTDHLCIIKARSPLSHQIRDRDKECSRQLPPRSTQQLTLCPVREEWTQNRDLEQQL